MIVQGVNREDLYDALSVANYACRGNLAFGEEPEPISEYQRSWRFSLRAKGLEGPCCRCTTGWLPERRLRGACFHANAAYAVAIFERAPMARVKVSRSFYYEGVDDFYAKLSKAKGTLSPQYLSGGCNCRRFYEDPEEALIPDVRVSGAWRSGTKLYQGLRGQGRDASSLARRVIW